MTEPFPGAPRARATASGTTVALSAGALRHNVESALAVAPSADRPGADPLAADAWGHGEAWVRGILSTAGVAGAQARRLDGATLYGLPGGVGAHRPVMRLSGTVLSTKTLLAGEGVSYGYVHRASADTRIALVTGGYAQGVVRVLGSRVPVAVAGALHPIVGRVAMDVCVVEIGDADVARGDEAVFFGDPQRGEPGLRSWMTATGLTAAELVAVAGVRGVRRGRG